MPDQEYTLDIGGEQRTLKSPKPLSDGEIRDYILKIQKMEGKGSAAPQPPAQAVRIPLRPPAMTYKGSPGVVTKETPQSLGLPPEAPVSQQPSTEQGLLNATAAFHTPQAVMARSKANAAKAQQKAAEQADSDRRFKKLLDVTGNTIPNLAEAAYDKVGQYLPGPTSAINAYRAVKGQKPLTPEQDPMRGVVRGASQIANIPGMFNMAITATSHPGELVKGAVDMAKTVFDSKASTKDRFEAATNLAVLAFGLYHLGSAGWKAMKPGEAAHVSEAIEKVQSDPAYQEAFAKIKQHYEAKGQTPQGESNAIPKQEAGSVGLGDQATLRQEVGGHDGSEGPTGAGIPEQNPQEVGVQPEAAGARPNPQGAPVSPPQEAPGQTPETPTPQEAQEPALGTEPQIPHEPMESHALTYLESVAKDHVEHVDGKWKPKGGYEDSEAAKALSQEYNESGKQPEAEKPSTVEQQDQHSVPLGTDESQPKSGQENAGPEPAKEPAKPNSVAPEPVQLPNENGTARPAVDSHGAGNGDSGLHEPGDTGAVQQPKAERPSSPSGNAGTGESGTPSPNTTGLANQVQERHVESGKINAEPEKLGGKSIADIHAAGEDFTNLDDAEALGTSVKHGMAENASNFEKASKADQLFHKAVQESEAHEKSLRDSGAPEGEIMAASETAHKLRERHQAFLDDIQKGKGHWSNIGRALQVGRNIENASIEQVLNHASSVKNRGQAKTTPLTDTERAQITAAHEKLVEGLKKEHESQADQYKRRIGYLEKYINKKKAEGAELPQAGKPEGKSPLTKSEAYKDKSVRARKVNEAKIAEIKARLEAIRKKSGPLGPSGRQSGAVRIPSAEEMGTLGELAKAYIDQGMLNTADIAHEIGEFLGEKVSQTDVAKWFHTHLEQEALKRAAARAPKDRDELAEQVAHAKTVLSLHGQIAKALDGELDETGKTPKVTPADIADLRKKLRDAKAKGGPGEKALDAIEAARKASKDKSLNTGLQAAYKYLSDTLAGKEPPVKPELTPEQKALAEQIKEVHAYRKSIQDAAKAHKEGSPAAKRLQKQLDDTNQKITDLKAAVEKFKAPKPQLDEGAKKVKADLDKSREELNGLKKDKAKAQQIADMEAELKLPEKEFIKRQQEKQAEREANAAKVHKDIEHEEKVGRLRAALRNRIEDLRPRTPAEKLAGYLRGVVVTSTSAYKHLIDGSIGYHVEQPMQSLMSQVFGRLPGGGGKSLKALAPEEGPGFTHKNITTLLTKKPWKNAWDAVTRDVDNVDTEHHSTGRGILNLAVRPHMAEKTALVRTPAFEVAKARILKNATPEQLKDPDFLRLASSYAGAAANDAALMGDNALGQHIGQGIDAALKSKKPSVQLFGLLLNELAPLRNMPSNMVKGATDLTGAGIARGGVIHAMELLKSKGGEIPHEAAAEILRAYKRGGVGAIAAALGLGMIPGFKAGGFYAAGVKPGKDDLNPGEFQIGKYRTTLGSLSRLGMGIQFWASIGNALQRKEGGEKAGWRGAAGILEEAPGIMGTGDMLKNIQEGKGGAALGNQVSEYNPSLIKRFARSQDLQPGTGSQLGYMFGANQAKPVPRKVDDFASAIKEGIPSPLPGNRQTLPARGIRATKEGQTYPEYARVMNLKEARAYLSDLKGGHDVPYKKDIPGKTDADKIKTVQSLISLKLLHSLKGGMRNRYDMATGKPITPQQRMDRIKAIKDAAGK